MSVIRPVMVCSPMNPAPVPVTPDVVPRCSYVPASAPYGSAANAVAAAKIGTATMARIPTARLMLLPSLSEWPARLRATPKRASATPGAVARSAPVRRSARGRTRGGAPAVARGRRTDVLVEPHELGGPRSLPERVDGLEREDLERARRRALRVDRGHAAEQ